MIAPAALVEHVEDLAQGLVADFSDSLRRQAKPVVGPDDITLIFEGLLDALQVFEMFVCLVAKQLAQLIEIELGWIAHAALAPAEKSFEPAHLTEDLSRFAHPHALRALKRKLAQKLFQLLHLVHHIA